MAMFKNTFFGMVQKQGLVHNTARAMKEFGLWGTIKKMYYYDELKFGECVGEDSFGNKYYEDKTEPIAQCVFLWPALIAALPRRPVTLHFSLSH